MSCIFCRIVAGEIPAEIVARGDGFAAFLDMTPLWEKDGAGSVHTIFRAGPRKPVAEVGAAIRRQLGS